MVPSASMTILSTLIEWDTLMNRAMADYLLVALKGQALEVACSLPKESQSNYNELVKALDRRFGTER